jgi:hypothetical protein
MLQSEVSMSDPVLMQVAHCTDELLEEEPCQVLWKGALILQHIVQRSIRCILVYDAQSVIRKKYLHTQAEHDPMSVPTATRREVDKSYIQLEQ